MHVWRQIDRWGSPERHGYSALQAHTEMDAKCRAEAKAAHFVVPAGPRECMRVDVDGNMEFLTVRALQPLNYMVNQGAMGDLQAQCHAQIEKARLAQLFELPHRDLRYIDPLVRPLSTSFPSLLQAGSNEGDGLAWRVLGASFVSLLQCRRGAQQEVLPPRLCCRAPRGQERARWGAVAGTQVGV